MHGAAFICYGLCLNKIIRHCKWILVYFDIWLQNKRTSNDSFNYLFERLFGQTFVTFLKWNGLKCLCAPPFPSMQLHSCCFQALIIPLSSLLFEWHLWLATCRFSCGEFFFSQKLHVLVFWMEFSFVETIIQNTHRNPIRRTRSTFYCEWNRERAIVVLSC